MPPPPSGQRSHSITDADVLSRRKEYEWGSYAGSSADAAYPQGDVLGEDLGTLDERALQGASRMSSAAHARPGAERPGAKRTATLDEEDDDFELDSRVPDKSRRVGNEAQLKRARTDMGPPPSGPPRPPSFDPGSPGSQVLGGDISGHEAPGASPYMEPDLFALSQKSRAISLASRKRKPQSRTAWSDRDSQLLIKAVDVYKCRWSTMEKDILENVIPFEHPRNQQALRDKARLLKQEFLK